MDLNDLRQATAASEKLHRAERDIEALAEYSVIGIVIDRGEGNLSPIRIERGGNSGTGRITSIGWSDDLQAALTRAMRAVFEDRANEARAELSRLGVSVAA